MKYWLITLVLLATMFPHTSQAATANQGSIYRQINAVRQTRRLPKLVLSTRLSRVARQRAELMAHQQMLAHIIPGQPSTWDMVRATNYTFSSTGEVLAGNMNDPSKIVRAWQLSTAHRSIINSRKFNQVGIAHVSVPQGKNLVTITVVLFAYHPKNTP